MEYIRPKLHFERYKEETPPVLFRNIAREIVYESQEKLNLSVNPDLSLWMVRLMSLNPKYGICTGKSFDRRAIEGLIKDCLDIIAEDPDNPFVATLKMQVYFMEHSIDKNRIISKQEAHLDERMQSLTRAIVDGRLKSKKDCEQYAKKIATDIIVHHAMGNPSKPKVVRETLNALNSMMSTNDLMAFSMLCEKDKLESLSGIREIVCGMRVFNKDAGHCGEGLVDIEEIVRSGYKTTKSQLNNSLKESEKRIDLLLSKILLNQIAPFSWHRLPAGNAKENDIIKSITFFRQYERFIHDLLTTLMDHQIHIDRLLKSFRNQLNDIHEIVKFRTAIPIAKIFPKFIKLAKLWQQLQNQLYILSEINTVNGQLMLLAESVSPLREITVAESVAAITATKTESSTTVVNSGANCSDNDGVNNNENVLTDDANGKVCRHKIIDTGSNELIKIAQYRGNLKVEHEAFCTWTLSVANGLLLAANLTIGIINYKNRYYAFSSVEAADMFLQNSELCLLNVVHVVRNNPELALLLGLYDTLKQHNEELLQIDDTVCASEPTRCSNVEIQTEKHPILYKKDKDYAWNIWDLHRKARKLANLQQCQTRSTQTAETAYRFAVGIQTHDGSIENPCQISREKCTTSTANQ